MKNLKLIICLCLAIATTSLIAQTKGHHGRKGDGQRIEKLAKALDLNDTQVSKMTELHDAYQQQFKALRNNTNLEKEAKKAQMKSMKADLDAKTQAILTTEQATKFAEMKAERKGRRGEMGQKRGHGKKHGGKGKGQKVDKMVEQLNLNATQTSDLKTLYADHKEQSKAIKSNEALDKTAKRAQFEKLREEKEVKVKSILNADQYARYVELKAERKENRKGKGKRGEQRKKY